jgi:hypothetical protein
MKILNRSLHLHIRASSPNHHRCHRFLRDLYIPSRRSMHRPSPARPYRTRALLRQLLAYCIDNMAPCLLTILRAPFLQHLKRLHLLKRKRRKDRRPAFPRDQYHTQRLPERRDDMRRNRPHHRNLLARNICKSTWPEMITREFRNRRHIVVLDTRHRRLIRLPDIVSIISTK